MNIKNLHHICIQTNNYEKSLDFYTRILGFSIIKETKNFHGRFFNTWLELDGIKIEMQTGKLGNPLEKWSSTSEGPVHLCFVVDDIKKAYKSIKNKGYNNFKVKDNKEIYKVENGYLFKVKAPEGTEIEIRDNPSL